MANFSENSTRHFYVLGSGVTVPKSTFIEGSSGKVLDINVPGDLAICTLEPGTGTEMFFKYVSPNGDNGANTIVRSPLIPLSKVNYVTIRKPVYRDLQTYQVILDPLVNGGNPVVGQDYILRFVFYGLAIGGQEVQYIKEGGAYRVRTGDTASTVYKALIDLAILNFSREPYPLVEFGPAGATPANITVTAVEQPWVLGKRQGTPLQFKVECVPIRDAGANLEIPWGVVTDVTLAGDKPTATSIFNGKVIADMEWFYVGGRADHQRQWTYPDNFDTRYVAESSLKYDTVDIDFYFSGDNEDVQKSRIVLSLALPNKVTSSVYTTKSPYGIDTLAKTLVSDFATLGFTNVTADPAQGTT
jgi:hypothetical protein